MSFKKDFVWGGASASYQIEGAAYEDGKGLSIWDMFCKQNGRIADGSSGDIACDHYHRYPQDVDIMKQIGYKGYRFSISWPRILPEGTGKINEKGLDFYDRLTEKLLNEGIEPYATLYHWDYPYDLYKKGGWMNPDSSKWFAEYTNVVANRLGDRVKNFFTFNEPQVFIGLCYDKTEHAPGISLPVWDNLQMMHNVLLGHGLSVMALRSAISDVKIGYAPTCGAHYPVTQTPENIEAARQAMFDVGDNWCWSAAVWSDPVILGEYPDKLIKRFEKQMSKIATNDMKTICQPLDFYGQNIYNGKPVESDGKNGYRFCDRKPGYDLTAVKWPITPSALYYGPKFLYERYKTPIYITENGLSCHDTVSLDGKVHDPNRIDFLNRYLKELQRAAKDGVEIEGYFHWCVTDNFEWHKGYTDRFGMVYCDFESQQRILKDSAYWYKKVIESNGGIL